MKVRVKSTGRVFQGDRTWLLAILEDAGLIEQIIDSPAPPPECNPVWTVGQSERTGETVLTVLCPRHGVTDRCLSGIPSDYHYSHCGKRTPVPKDIRNKFNELQPARVEHQMLRTVR